MNCGHGAYADSDFHHQAFLAGCNFIDLNIPELHYLHDKRDERGVPINQDKLKLLSLDNFIYYCYKWKLPIVLAENVALKSNVRDPKKYVSQRSKVLANSLQGSRQGI